MCGALLVVFGEHLPQEIHGYVCWFCFAKEVYVPGVFYHDGLLSLEHEILGVCGIVQSRRDQFEHKILGVCGIPKVGGIMLNTLIEIMLQIDRTNGPSVLLRIHSDCGRQFLNQKGKFLTRSLKFLTRSLDLIS